MVGDVLSDDVPQLGLFLGILGDKGSGLLLWDNEGEGQLSVELVGDTNNTDFGNERMLGQVGFHLGRSDLETVDLQHLLETIDDEDLHVLVDRDFVASADPTVDEGFLGGLLQKIDELGYRGPFLDPASQQRSYDLPKFVRESKFLPVSTSWWSLAIYDLFHFGVTWLESDRCACRDVESLSIGPGAIEGQTRVSFDEVVVRSDLWSFISRRMQHVSRERTHLDWLISVVCNLDSDPLTTLVNHDAFVLDYDSTRKSVLCIRRWLRCRE